MPKSYVFSGQKEVVAKQVQDLLSIGVKGAQRPQINPRGNK